MSPLDAELRGIQIWSKGQLLDTTLAEAANRDMSDYIFGEIDVPALYEDDSPISPFDMSRSGALNPKNPLVRAAYAFIGSKAEVVRRMLVEQEKARKATEETRHLAAQADEIAQALNEDFDSYRKQLRKALAKPTGGYDNSESLASGGDDSDDLLGGGDDPADLTGQTGSPGAQGGQRRGGDEPRTLNPTVEPGTSDSPATAKHGGGAGNARRPRGGFSIDFKGVGQDELRAKYIAETRTILINLDHPQVAAAKGDGPVEGIEFRRLAFEIAFSEYSIALSFELAQRGHFMEPVEAVFEVRDAINRLARRSAALYARASARDAREC
jgi:hypothetical protein